MELNLSPQPALAADPLPPNSVFYQVLKPRTIAGPGGETGFDMIGPFADLPSASQTAARFPGALLTATVVLFRTPTTLTTSK